QEQVGQQRADVDVRVQIVDELRVDRRLREHHAYRRLRVARVAVDDVDEAAVRRRVELEPRDEARKEGAEVGQRRVEAAQMIANLRTRARFGAQALRRVGQEEFVGLFDVVRA